MLLCHSTVILKALGLSAEDGVSRVSAGLNAASVFIEAYGGHLEEMDPSFLLYFLPLQDMLAKHFASSELLPQSGTALMDYLRRAPPQEVRLFIWTLEEHRHHYDHCHTILDAYFEILGKWLLWSHVLETWEGGVVIDRSLCCFSDGDCQVMKKSDNVNDNVSMTFCHSSRDFTTVSVECIRDNHLLQKQMLI